MSETEVIQTITEVHCDGEALLHTANVAPQIAIPKAALDGKSPKRYDIHQPSPDSDIKEVHHDGLQPYQITRKSPRPGRPMTTISSLPSGEIVAGTKAGRREYHIFAGNPLQGTTVWLPVVVSSNADAWNFNANDRALRWREVKEKSPRVFQLVDAITSELLVEYCATTPTGAALQFYADLEESLELLVMASILAVIEARGTGDRSVSRERLLGGSSSTPESSREPSPMTGTCIRENECDLAVGHKLAQPLRESC